MPKGHYHRHPATHPHDLRLSANRKPSANTLHILGLMERERSCDAVSKITGNAIQDVWWRVKRWRPDLLGPRYIKRSARK